MLKYVYLIAFIAFSSVLVSCDVQPVADPSVAYLGKYNCTLISKTTKMNGVNESVATKTYAGTVTKVADKSLTLNLTTLQGSEGLTIPLMLTGQALVIPQFVIDSSYTSAGTTTYLSNYYSGNGKLQSKTLYVTLNSANFKTVGATGNQSQISNSDMDCTCVRKID